MRLVCAVVERDISVVEDIEAKRKRGAEAPLDVYCGS
jgi:hypothetical protein